MLPTAVSLDDTLALRETEELGERDGDAASEPESRPDIDSLGVMLIDMLPEALALILLERLSVAVADDEDDKENGADRLCEELTETVDLRDESGEVDPTIVAVTAAERVSVFVANGETVVLSVPRLVNVRTAELDMVDVRADDSDFGALPDAVGDTVAASLAGAVAELCRDSADDTEKEGEPLLDRDIPAEREVEADVDPTWEREFVCVMVTVGEGGPLRVFDVLVVDEGDTVLRSVTETVEDTRAVLDTRALMLYDGDALELAAADAEPE